MSDGQLTIEVKAAGELVGAFEVFDAVTAGQADMYHAADYYFISQHPGLAFFTGVPFGMTATELNNWYYHGNGMALHDEAGRNLWPEVVPGRQHRHPGWWLVPQRNQRARRFQRSEVPYARPWRQGAWSTWALGPEPAGRRSLSGAGIGCDRRNRVDRPWADEKAGFQEITKFYYTAGMHEPSAGLSVATNRDVFDSLTPQQQA